MGWRAMGDLACPFHNRFYLSMRIARRAFVKSAKTGQLAVAYICDFSIFFILGSTCCLAPRALTSSLLGDHCFAIIYSSYSLMFRAYSSKKHLGGPRHTRVLGYSLWQRMGG